MNGNGAKCYFISKKAKEWAIENRYTNLLRDIDEFLHIYKAATKKSNYYDAIPAEKVEEMLASTQKRLDKLTRVLESKKVTA